MSETNVSKKARQREQLVLALLQQPSFDKAAASIGMSTTTAWRIRKTAAFQEEYKKARGEAHSQSIARLQQASSAAVSTLVKVMVDPNAPATSRVRAAHWVLSHASEGTECEDLRSRVDKMELDYNTVLAGGKIPIRRD